MKKLFIFRVKSDTSYSNNPTIIETIYVVSLDCRTAMHSIITPAVIEIECLGEFPVNIL